MRTEIKVPKPFVVGDVADVLIDGESATITWLSEVCLMIGDSWFLDVLDINDDGDAWVFLCQESEED